MVSSLVVVFLSLGKWLVVLCCLVCSLVFVCCVFLGVVVCLWCRCFSLLCNFRIVLIVLLFSVLCIGRVGSGRFV